MGTFGIGLQTRNLGTKGREMTNPFTGETSIAYIDDGATPEELHRGNKILDDAKAEAADPDNGDLFRLVTLPQGSQLNIVYQKEGGRVDVLDDLTSESSAFLYDFCQATGMLVTSTIDPKVIAVLPNQYHEGISQRWPTHTRIGSSSELQEWMLKEIDAGRIV